MSSEHRAGFRILRLDDPALVVDEASDTTYRAFWIVGGRTFRVRVWSLDAWARRPVSTKPVEARLLSGQGWMVVRPIEEH